MVLVKIGKYSEVENHYDLGHVCVFLSLSSWL